MKVKKLVDELERITRVNKPKPGTVGGLLAYLNEGLRLTPTKPGCDVPTFRIFEGERGIQDFKEQLETHIKKFNLTPDSTLAELDPTLTYFFRMGISRFLEHMTELLDSQEKEIKEDYLE